jgi:hypothetical protein
VALRIDATPPALAWGAPSPAPNAAGWNNTPVDIPFTASDSLSGVAGEPVAGLRLAGEGANQNRTLTLADVAGNTATFLSPSVNIDSTPPLVAVAASPGSVWPRGKRAVSVQVSGSATDVLAGLNPSTAAFSVVDDAGTTLASGPVTLGADGSYAFTVTLAARKGPKCRQYRIAVAVSDLAGNAGTGAAIVKVSPGR